MPHIQVTLPETDQSISRPVIFDMISQIQDITKMGKDSKIFFPGTGQKMQTPGTSIDSTTERFAIFNTDRIAFIEVEEDYDRESIGMTAITRKEHIPVFLDNKLQVKIAPIYATSIVTINFKYRCFSKTEALKWRDDIRVRASQMRDTNLHNLTYHYLLPAELLLVLRAIYTNREATEAYGQTIEEFITSNSSSRLTVVGDLVGQDARLAIAETQMRIVGMFGFDILPEKPEKDDTSGTWTVTFSYKFTYEKPIACNMEYPIMVHNKLLPPGFIVFTDKSYDLTRQQMSFPDSLRALNGFENDSIMEDRLDKDILLRIPSYDDYDIPQVPYGSGSIFIALCEVVEDKKALLNLNELGDICLDEDILNFIKESEYPFIDKLYKSILHISLYRNNHLASDRSLVCNNTLDISSPIELNLRNQHRVRLSIVCDLSLLDTAALSRLKKYPKALVKIIGAMNDLLRSNPDFTELGDKSYISNLDFNSIYRLLTGRDYGVGGTLGMTWPYGRVNRSMFDSIPDYIVANYRTNRVNTNIVQISGIVAIKDNSK